MTDMTEPRRETEEPSPPFRAVIFDLGGVVLGSPLHAIASFERELGIPAGFVNRVVVDTGASGAWARHERGELAREHFMREFSGECQSAGHALSVPDLFDRMAEVSHPRPRMLEAIRRIRARGLLTAALTNNFPSDAEDSGGRALRACFDDFFESSVLGLHKPDPRIYQHACRALDVAALLLRVVSTPAAAGDHLGPGKRALSAVLLRQVGFSTAMTAWKCGGDATFTCP